MLDFKTELKVCRTRSEHPERTNERTDGQTDRLSLPPSASERTNVMANSSSYSGKKNFASKWQFKKFFYSPSPPPVCPAVSGFLSHYQQKLFKLSLSFFLCSGNSFIPRLSFFLSFFPWCMSSDQNSPSKNSTSQTIERLFFILLIPKPSSLFY